MSRVSRVSRNPPAGSRGSLSRVTGFVLSLSPSRTSGLVVRPLSLAFSCCSVLPPPPFLELAGVEPDETSPLFATPCLVISMPSGLRRSLLSFFSSSSSSSSSSEDDSILLLVYILGEVLEVLEVLGEVPGDLCHLRCVPHCESLGGLSPEGLQFLAPVRGLLTKTTFDSPHPRDTCGIFPRNLLLDVIT